MTNSKVSIITVNLNNADGLIDTIRSVLSQTYNNYEFIIIDGGSNDESKNIIELYSGSFAYWCSERDGGIYFGMNKGLEHVTGEYVIFLNSGDCFVNKNVLEKVFRNTNYTEDIIVGRQQYILKSGRHSKSRRINPDEVDSLFFWGNTLPHQCTFVKSVLFRKLGGYNTDYRIVSDWIFWYRAVRELKVTIRSVNILISIMQPGGISSSPEEYRSEVVHFLMSQINDLTERDWREIIDRCHGSYQLTCATRNGLGKLLVKIAKFINK